MTIVNMHKKMVKIARVVREILRSRTDTHTHTHTHTHTDALIIILRYHFRGRSKKTSKHC